MLKVIFSLYLVLAITLQAQDTPFLFGKVGNPVITAVWESTTPPDILSNLVALWQNGDTVDVTGRGNDLSAYGGFSVTASTLAGFDSVWTFDGIDGYLSRAGTSDLVLYGSDFTISFWVYFASDHTNGSIIFKGLNWDDRDYTLLCTINGDDVDISSENFGQSITTVPKTNWENVTITENGVSIKTYYNGVLISTNEIAGSPDNGHNFLVALRKGEEFDSYSKFSLAQLAIYKRALTQEQIAYLYNGGDGRLIEP